MTAFIKSHSVGETHIYPDFSRDERVVDGIIHFLGVFGSILAFAYLFSASVEISAHLLPALIVYAVCSIALFCFSAAYHMTPRPEYRPLLRRFDQAAIFFKISGTYTPLVYLVDTTFSYVLLTAVWLTAFIGAVSKLISGNQLGKHTISIYMGLSWSALLLLWQLSQKLDFWSVWLVVVGGVLYTTGVIFHQWHELKYNNAIWHAFVLTAASCHFLAVVNPLF